MGTIWLHDLPTVLAPLAPAFHDGWETRSRSSGGYDSLAGIAIHHTASNTSPESDMNYMWHGSPDRPVGAIYLARDGRVTVGAAGATNTQGKGGPLTTSRGTVPLDKGNQNMIAIEAANAGTGEAWPKAQTDAYLALVNALIKGYGFKPGDVYGHYDYCAPSCPGRKIDPAGPSPFGTVNPSGTWNIATFRSALGGAPAPEPPQPEPTPPPGDWWTPLMARLPVLRQGSSGPPVRRMQHLLAADGFMDAANTANYDSVFGSGTAGALNRFKTSAGGAADGTCDAWTWGALMHTVDGIPTIVKGANGPDVRRMQHLLAAAGFMNEANVSNYDGAWGSGTDGAKQRFDVSRGLTPSPPTDCGQKSWTALLGG